MTDLRINGDRYRHVQVRELKDDTYKAHAGTLVKMTSDGYDTVGIQVGDTMYLAYGRGLDAKPGDEVTLDGQAGTVMFFENEHNSFKEGFNTIAHSGIGQGLMQSVAGAFTVIPTALTVGALTWAIQGLRADEDKVINSLTK